MTPRGTSDGREGPDPDGERLRRGDDAGGGGSAVRLRDSVRDDCRLRASVAGTDPGPGVAEAPGQDPGRPEGDGRRRRGGGEAASMRLPPEGRGSPSV